MMNATLASASIATQLNPIATFGLFKSQPLFRGDFLQDWLKQARLVSSAGERVYAAVVRELGANGYGELSCRRIAAAVNRSVSQVERHLRQLRNAGLLIIKRQGLNRPNMIAINYHPTMGLPVDALADRLIPPDLLGLPPISDSSADCDTISDQDNMPVPDQDSSLAPTILLSERSDLKDGLGHQPSILPISEHSQEQAESAIEPQASDNSGQPIPAAPAPQQSPAKERQPRSNYSIELCWRFAQSEQERKRSIEDAGQFAEACYWTGKHDHEIARWLKKRAGNAAANYRSPAPADKAEQSAARTIEVPTVERYDPNCPRCWQGNIPIKTPTPILNGSDNDSVWILCDCAAAPKPV